MSPSLYFTSSYNAELVILSVIFSTLTSYVAVELASRVSAASPGVRKGWLAGGATAMGLGVWSMHYIGMLAFVLPIPVLYHIPTVALSLAAAIASSWVALSSVSHPGLTFWRAARGACVMGLGIATMHYLGMAAMRMRAHCGWSLAIIALSIVLAIVISAVAILLIFRFKSAASSSFRRMAGILLMGLAIPVMHYTGMAAANFRPMAEAPDFKDSVGISLLGTAAISLGSFLVLAVTLALALLDRRSASQSAALERQIGQLIESIQAVLWQGDLKTGRCIFVNKKAPELLGFPETEWLSDPDFLENHCHPDDRALVKVSCRQVADGFNPVEFEFRFVKADSEVIWLRTYLHSFTSASGRHQFTGIAHDVTVTKVLQSKLIEQRRHFDTMMSSTPDYIYFKDKDSRFIQISCAMALKCFQLNRPEDAIGKSDQDFFASNHALEALKAEQEIMRTGLPILNFEEREDWPDGRVTWSSTSKLPLYNVHGQIAGTFGISRDITRRKLDELSLLEKSEQLASLNASLEREIQERKTLQGQLLQAHKLEAIGQLAAGVAHEINTPIQFVSDNCSFLGSSFVSLAQVLQKYNQLLDSVKTNRIDSETIASVEQSLDAADMDYLSEEIPRAIDQSLDGLERVAQIVRAMKEFSHPGSLQKAPADLNKAIQSTLIVCRNEYKYVANLTTDLDPNLPEVQCLLGEVNQVILNLVVNAAHAIADAGRGPDSGLIRIVTAHCDDSVEVRISDNGSGIPDKIRDRIFEPFFTTKDVGKGSGQGLALARNVIVNKHQGSLTFETEEGKGTTFIIRIPSKEPANESEASPKLQLV